MVRNHRITDWNPEDTAAWEGGNNKVASAAAAAATINFLIVFIGFSPWRRGREQLAKRLRLTDTFSITLDAETNGEEPNLQLSNDLTKSATLCRRSQARPRNWA